MVEITNMLKEFKKAASTIDDYDIDTWRDGYFEHKPTQEAWRIFFRIRRIIRNTKPL